MTKLPVGTRVNYHGSLGYLHGEYRIIGYSDFSRRPEIFTPEVITEHFPDGVAYDLWPVGEPLKFGDRFKGIYFIRRTSFDVIS